jgi:CRISPR-associated protein Cas4
MSINSNSDDDLLMLSGIQHLAFCERQWALIHIEQQWTENVKTTEGHHLHERVDDPLASDKRGKVITYRAFPLISRQLGLTGRADVVELEYSEEHGVQLEGYEGKWLLHPVEYKRGKQKPDDRDAVQVCAQAICLEEMFNTEIPQGSLFYAETRHRVIVELTPELRQCVFDLARRMHQLFDGGITPLPVYKSHCKSCSLIDICLPQSMSGQLKASDYLRNELETD